MIHEGLTLDLSGRHRWLVEWASRVRTLVLLTLFVNLFLPWGIALEASPAALALALVLWLGKLMALAVAVAVLESVAARMRLYRVPEFLGLAFLLALLALASDAMLR
jgi:formate hydrogenlyase subunit 4